MNNEENLNIPQPAPAWDYYIIWHSCQHIKARIDEALKIMNGIEIASNEVDKELHDLLDLASDKLVEVIHELDHDDDETA
ncbi:hypothetical protein [Nostoc sp.]|uniref:hypothetical protein n=1 Tax=Nostoc sp. TaxID=1180 RepID=UPI002FFC1908